MHYSHGFLRILTNTPINPSTNKLYFTLTNTRTNCHAHCLQHAPTTETRNYPLVHWRRMRSLQVCDVGTDIATVRHFPCQCVCMCRLINVTNLRLYMSEGAVLLSSLSTSCYRQGNQSGKLKRYTVSRSHHVYVDSRKYDFSRENLPGTVLL